MESEIIKLGIIDNISIYFDKYQSKTEFLLGRKSKEVESIGYVFIPNENWNTPNENFIEARNKKSEIENVDINFIVGGNDDLEFYKIVIERLKNK
jgi:hypothetical protein